jgi:hypothetical protein
LHWQSTLLALALVVSRCDDRGFRSTKKSVLDLKQAIAIGGRAGGAIVVAGMVDSVRSRSAVAATVCTARLHVQPSDCDCWGMVVMIAVVICFAAVSVFVLLVALRQGYE